MVKTVRVCKSVWLLQTCFVHTGYCVGWENNSIGFHSDDGGIFHQRGTKHVKVKTYGVGDVVGVGGNPKKLKVFFTLNGEKIYETKCEWLRKDGLFPSVSLRSTDGKHVESSVTH